MGKFVVAYKGGSMGESPEQQSEIMERWMGWFSSMGPAVLDGGNPFAGGVGVGSDRTTVAASAQLTGYSILQADSLDAAVELAKGCPVLDNGGALEVYEALEL